MNEVVIDDSQREMCAVLVMRTMLTDYCDDTGVSFNDVFFRFVTSPAYKMLFDYSTGLWMEGPDYLREVFEDVVNPASDFNFSIAIQQIIANSRRNGTSLHSPAE